MKKVGFILGGLCLIMIRVGVFFLPQNTEVVAQDVGLIQKPVEKRLDTETTVTAGHAQDDEGKSSKSQDLDLDKAPPPVSQVDTDPLKAGLEIFDPVNGIYYDLKAFNALPKETLMNFKGIGEKTAEAILKYRQEVGPFTSFEELLNIKGIGEKKLASILLNSR